LVADGRQAWLLRRVEAAQGRVGSAEDGVAVGGWPSLALQPTTAPARSPRPRRSTTGTRSANATGWRW